MSIPTQLELDKVIDAASTTLFICDGCRKTIRRADLILEFLPSDLNNMAGLNRNTQIPTCPHCKQMHFFGMKEKGT